jgi:hypothetical protein
MLALWGKGCLGLLDATMLALSTSDVNQQPPVAVETLGEIPGTEAIHD